MVAAGRTFQGAFPVLAERRGWSRYARPWGGSTPRVDSSAGGHQTTRIASPAPVPPAPEMSQGRLGVSVPPPGCPGFLPLSLSVKEQRPVHSYPVRQKDSFWGSHRPQQETQGEGKATGRRSLPVEPWEFLFISRHEVLLCPFSLLSRYPRT